MTDDKNPKSERRIDPETGFPLTKDGRLNEGTGSGHSRLKVIPPADMQRLVENGIAPYEVPNWDRADVNSNWYVGYRKFSPERKAIFLTKLEQTGRIRLSAHWAGIDYNTVNKHRKKDPDFDHACKTAEDLYHEMVAASITHQARVGQVEEKWDKEGRLISRRVSYETRLRELLLKRADPSYNEVRKEEISVTSGVVVVPPPIDGVESWEDTVRKYTSMSVDGGGVGKGALTDGESQTIDTEGDEIRPLPDLPTGDD